MGPESTENVKNVISVEVFRVSERSQLNNQYQRLSVSYWKIL